MTYQEVLSELDGMVDWFLLGTYLGVPASNLEEVEEDHSKSTRRRAQVIRLWMKTEEPSWQKLVTALVGAGERKRAIKLADKYGNGGLKYVSMFINCLSFVFQ